MEKTAPPTPAQTAVIAVRINQAAAMLGVSRRTIYNLIEQGELRVAKIGSASLIPIEDLQRLVSDRATRSEAA